MTNLLNASSKRVKLTCKQARVTFPTKELKRVHNTVKKYFSCPLASNFESLDRRFTLTNDKQVRFQGPSREHKMPLDKLTVSLALPRTQLFAYLQIEAKRKRVQIFYTKSEKTIIKQFVRLSKYKKSFIPCTAMHNICR